MPAARWWNRFDSGSRFESFLFPSPITYGMCPKRGMKDVIPTSYSASYRAICRGVDDSRSSPRSTWVIPIRASSTGFVNV